MKEEHIIHQLMVFGFMLKAVDNASSPDISLLFSREEKQLYNRMLKVNREFQKVVEKRFPKETHEFFDENSYAYLDILTLLRNVKYADKVKELFSMLKLYADGQAKIVDGGEVSEIPHNALVSTKNEFISTDPGDEHESI